MHTITTIHHFHTVGHVQGADIGAVIFGNRQVIQVQCIFGFQMAAAAAKAAVITGALLATLPIDEFL